MRSTSNAAGTEKGKRIVGAERQALAKDLVKRYTEGESIRALAASTGRSYGFVHRVLTESGVQVRQRGGSRRRMKEYGTRDRAAQDRPARVGTARSQRAAKVTGPGKHNLQGGGLRTSGYELRAAGGEDAAHTVVLAEPGTELRRLIERYGVPEESAAGTAYMDVAVYLGSDDSMVTDQVLAVVDAVVDAMGYDGPYEVDVRRGSVFRRSRAIAKRGIDAADLRTRLAKVERSLELAYLDRRQADVDAIESEAVRRLVDSLKDVPQACLRIGSIFLIKYEDVRGPVLVVRTLSPLEVHALVRFPEVQGNPRTALEALATAVASLQTVGTEEKPLIP
jgi:hypothetical protein